ncbi:MAG: MarR family transcriptional regulator [Candidatus Lokiarchaeota archaeon]|nr:MarR family transcriptional regulator [Candidatus Lokiarchaeota archaeon]
MLTEQNKKEFFDATDSLKRFKRAEIKDEKNRSLIEALYTDLLPEDQVFKMCHSDNTTFLIGRKGTGKSTIILRLEKEYREKKNYLSCYIDTKTVFESTKSEYHKLDYLKGRIPEYALEKYLIERSFIQNILKAISKELEEKANTFLQKLKANFGINKSQKVKKRIEQLQNKIENNEHLKSIELPVINEYYNSISGSLEKEEANYHASSQNASMKITHDTGVGYESKQSSSSNARRKNIDSWEKSFSGALLKVFQIRAVIDEIKEILSMIEVKKLVIFLDDFSEVGEKTIRNFVNVILEPLNNWADEFACFKVAAYPNRVYYGGIDKGKIDIVELDFYDLYSNYDKSTMESLSVDFTRRLISQRIRYFSTANIEDFFDTRSMKIEEYFNLLFKASMNVPRIIGYLLFYCHQTHISLGRKINKTGIESASKKYYEKVISSFFDITCHSKMSFNDKVSELQQKELLGIIINKLKQIRKDIVTGELTGEVYKKEKTNPFTSHFYLKPTLEQFLRTLELNFFITKYNEMSDRDGSKVSIYGLNFGLALIENLRWGKPEGNAFRKYFIARPFDFNKSIEDFLKDSKKIICLNPSCGKIYPYEQLSYLKFAKMRCVECQTQVEVRAVSESILNELQKIDKAKLLPNLDLTILYELNNSNEKMYARDIAEELDVSSYLIAKRAEKLDKDKGLVHRDRSDSLLKYSITEKAKSEYFNIEQ